MPGWVGDSSITILLQNTAARFRLFFLAASLLSPHSAGNTPSSHSPLSETQSQRSDRLWNDCTSWQHAFCHKRCWKQTTALMFPHSPNYNWGNTSQVNRWTSQEMNKFQLDCHDRSITNVVLMKIQHCTRHNACSATMEHLAPALHGFLAGTHLDSFQELPKSPSSVSHHVIWCCCKPDNCNCHNTFRLQNIRSTAWDILKPCNCNAS